MKQNLNIRVTKKYEGLIERLEELARKEDRSVNKYVLALISKSLKFKRK